MTKDEAKKVLIRDVVTVLIGFIVGGLVAILILFPSLNFGESLMLFLLFGLILGGVPLGWKLASKVITAVGLLSIILKFFLSLILGWIAAPITIIKDIILLVKIKKGEL